MNRRTKLEKLFEVAHQIRAENIAAILFAASFIGG
jgi:hypothetical protein